MILLVPVGKTPAPYAHAGFVPRKAEDDIVRHLLRPCFPKDGPRDGEVLLLAGFDVYKRLVALERADGDGIGRCSIPPRCWQGLMGRDVATVLMAHNHPSGAAWPSNADIRCTHETAQFLRFLDIELTDHLIVVDTGHFSFRRAQLM